MIGSISFRISLTISPRMLLYSIASNILSVASLVGPLAGCERFRGVSIRSVPVAVGLSVKLNVAAGEEVSIVSGGSVE